ncbi:MAG TPA: very short patch repair endonuclease [Phycisphaerae bacterium]|mgnify:CR=1 FL=1|nr:very short patch repair endonuclease [Phycisphaerae bacterium]HQL73525.1 very short patch repair endonuclease [Phycisphaerae bacterium]
MSRWPGNAQREQTTFGRLRRSELMSLVRSTGNKTTERCLVSLLREAGLKGWRRHLPLPGKPDFVWRSARVAVFVDGCFWHGHDCGKCLDPKTNAKAWRDKIAGNQARDRKVTRALRKEGWKVIRIWECELKKNPRRCMARIAEAVKKPQEANQKPRHSAA